MLQFTGHSVMQDRGRTSPAGAGDCGPAAIASADGEGLRHHTCLTGDLTEGMPTTQDQGKCALEETMWL